jgi:hypothetical protein
MFGEFVGDLLGKGGSVIKTCPICRITRSVVPPEHNGVCVCCEDKLAGGFTAEAIAAQSASFLAVQAINNGLLPEKQGIALYQQGWRFVGAEMSAWNAYGQA